MSQQHAWDKRPDESPEAWEAFQAYRDSGDSIATVAQRLSKSKPLLTRWSAKYDWQERRSAWLVAQDQATTQTRTRALARTEEERLEAVQKMNDQHAKVARAFIGKIAERLQNLDPLSLKPRDVCYWFDVAVKVERQARGAPAAELALNGGDDGPGASDDQQAAEERVSRILGEVMAAGAPPTVVRKPN